MTFDQKQLWLQGWKKVVDDEYPHELGNFRIKVIDFAHAVDRVPFLKPEGVSRFGWLLFIGGPNDPIVGAEDNPLRAVQRAHMVRSSLVGQIAERSFSPECAGCGAQGVELEPCPACGNGTCNACIVEKQGCGCEGVAQRAVPLAEIAEEARDRNPLKSVGSLEEQQAEEEQRLSKFEVQP